MLDYKTPGVYIVEEASLGNSVVPASTAIPAFIGYTDRAKRVADGDLHLKPTLIQSMLDYGNWFGGPQLKVMLGAGGIYSQEDIQPDLQHPMHYALQLYFANGGGPAYIVSVGGYPDPGATEQVSLIAMQNGLDALDRQDDASLVYFTDAMAMDAGQRYSLFNLAIMKAGEQQDRFNIFDVGDGQIDAFWTGVTANPLGFAAAYYPDLQTTLPVQYVDHRLRFRTKPGVTNTDDAKALDNQTLAWVMANRTDPKVKNIVTDDWLKSLKANIAAKPGLVLHPGPAVLGVIAHTDRNRGVWKAPANVSLNGVASPTIPLNDDQQASMHIPGNGKSINAIRQFQGKGTLVWGARTLDGNSNDWRYIQVRRTIIYIEQSLKNALQPMVFEPNDAGTWAKVRNMVEAFLGNVWRDGGLAGAKPEDAFIVQCGLGSSMTTDDILNGRLVVNVALAVSRPAEYIFITLTQSISS